MILDEIQTTFDLLFLELRSQFKPIILRNMIQELTWDLLSLNGVGLLNFHVVVDGPSPDTLVT